MEIVSFMNYVGNLLRLDRIFVEFKRCEDIHSGNKGGGDQSRIDQMLRDCNFSLFLFKTKAGEFTIHEYDEARSLQNRQREQSLNEKNIHEINVYTLKVKEEERTNELKSFLKRLEDENVFYLEVNDIYEIILRFILCILNHFGIYSGGQKAQLDNDSESNRFVYNQFENARLRYEQCRQKLHEEIDNTLSMIKQKCSVSQESVAAKVCLVINLYKQADFWSEESCYNKEKHAAFLLDYIKFLYDYGLYLEAEDVCWRLLAKSKEIFDKDSVKRAEIYNILGLLLRKQDEYQDALKYCLKALKIRKKQLGKNDPNTARSYSNVGIVYEKMRKYRKAYYYCKKP